MMLSRSAFGSMLAVVAMSFGAVDRPARAELVVTGSIAGSGINANLSSEFQRDSNWNIVAIPSGPDVTYAPGFSPPAIPYAAYVPRTVNAAGPTGWLGGNTGVNGSQGGYTADGNTYYWISPNSTVNAIVSGVDINDPATWYHWIAALTFTVPRDDNYYLNFPSAVDNRLGYYINGTIDTTNPRQPAIDGGTQIGTTSTAPGQFRQISNNAGGPVFLTAGTVHTAYMVLTDLGADTGVLIGPAVFSTVPVPEPSTWALAAIAGGGLVPLARRRRRSFAGAAPAA